MSKNQEVETRTIPFSITPNSLVSHFMSHIRKDNRSLAAGGGWATFT